jgi:hypothetical protein
MVVRKEERRARSQPIVLVVILVYIFTSDFGWISLFWTWLCWRLPLWDPCLRLSVFVVSIKELLIRLMMMRRKAQEGEEHHAEPVVRVSSCLWREKEQPKLPSLLDRSIDRPTSDLLWTPVVDAGHGHNHARDIATRIVLRFTRTTSDDDPPTTRTDLLVVARSVGGSNKRSTGMKPAAAFRREKSKDPPRTNRYALTPFL